MTDTENKVPRVHYDDEFDVWAILGALWDNKWLIGIIVSASTAVSIALALTIPDVYRAEALLAPNSQEGVGMTNALVAQYGGLAGLAGISLDRGSVDKTSLGIEVLKSRKFVSEFVKRHNILVPLMAAEGWDRAGGRLKIDADLYDVDTEEWVRKANPPRGPVPTDQESYEAFRRALAITQDRKSGFVTISFEHYSPDVASRWVTWLVEDLNANVMREEVAEAERAISYLNSQIEKTSNAELRKVFFDLIEEQTKVVMLAKVTPEYLFEVIDPPVSPEKRVKPNRLLIVALGFLGGGLLALVIVLTRGSPATSGR